MNYQVIIPARGGSKRLPGKNIMDLGGIPLICHSIRYAKKHTPISSIYVNTDDPEISKIAESEGVKITIREQGLGSDTTTTLEVLQSQLNWFKNRSIPCDAMILLQPTNPLRPDFLLKKAIEKFEESHRGSLASFSVLNRKFGKIENNHFIPQNYQPGQRMQDISPSYFENGLIYITRSDIIQEGSVISQDVFPLVIDHPYASVDIDELEDLHYASFVLKNFPNL